MKREQEEKALYHIGVLIGNVYTHHPKELIHGIYAAAENYPVNLEIFPGTQSSGFYHDLTGEAGEHQFEYQFNTIYDFALYGDLDALIISYGTLCIFLNEKEQKKFFRKYQQIPHVILEERDRSGRGSHIISDNYKGICRMVEHLITVHGYRRILHISGPKDNTDATERRSGYLDTMEKHGLPVTEDMILYGDYSEYMDAEVAAFLQAHPDAEAICAANDGMAVSAYKACERLGLQVGKDIAITGYDNISIASSLTPALTTIEQNGYDMGYMALVKAVALCRGDKREGVVLSAMPVWRSSCGCDETDRAWENTLGALEENKVRWRIDDAVRQMIPKVVLNTQDHRDQQFAARQLLRLVSYVVERVYLSKHQIPIDIHYKNIRHILQEVMTSRRSKNISVSNFVEQIDEFLISLAETEPEGAQPGGDKKLLLMRLMKYINEYMNNFSRYEQAMREINYNKRIWLGPLHVREMVEYGYREQEVYLEAVRGLNRQKIESSYLLLFENPVQYDGEEEWNCPERLYLAACHVGEDARTYEKGKRPVITREHGFSSLFRGSGHTYVAFSLFFQQIQYGVLLCEIGSDGISSTYAVSLQLATGIHLLELNKKEHLVQQKLKETMNELQTKNQVLRFISNSDELTGLLNRRGLIEELLRQMKQRFGERAYLLFADLDHLKQINDTYGHGEGDYAIRQIGEILKAELGKEALVARIGGDEFAAVILGITGKDKAQLVQRIRQECEERNKSSDKRYYVECSVGLLEFVCEPHLDITRLLQSADAVMYQAKTGRRASVLKDRCIIKE